MSKKYDKFLRNEQWLYQKYWVDKRSPDKIAEGIGCAGHTVLDALKKQGIQIRAKSEARKGRSTYWQLNDKKWLYGKYWDEELSIYKIGIIVGCSKGTVWNALKRHKIGIRKRAEAYKGEKAPNFGKHLSKETKQKISDALKRSSYWQLNNKEWLYKKYWGEMLSSIVISKIVGCNCSTIQRALKRCNIKIRTTGETQKGKSRSERTKKKISEANRKFTPAQRHLNKNIRKAIFKSLKNQKKGKHWEEVLGYTLAELMATLEKEFRQGMTWDNYGAWHVDHMIPLAKFDFDSTEDPEFKKAWRLNNLQPLWAGENIKKRDKFMFF